MFKKISEIVAIIFFSFFCALNYCIFIFPNKFAPAGVDGVCTMIQDLLHINMGYLAFAVNLPLLISAFLILNRDFAVKSSVFIVFFSLSMVLLEKIDLSAFLYSTSTSVVLAPVAAGVVRGFLYAATLKLNGSAGGIDIISALIKHKKPYLNFMNIIFIINMLIAAASYFVYDKSLEPVICCIVYAFVTSTTCNRLRESKNEIIQFEIFAKNPQQLCDDIKNKLKLKATVIDGHGASGANTKMVLCAVRKEAAPFVEELILEHPECITFKNTVSGALEGVTYN